ncbi:hypothetical protein [Endozoicomonas sp. ONNA2]|uniref:hypothetical protein n=1 Tax=Endozoicomonas sp. ONNA2 TaxID=2828741 RepID=UPI0021476CB3|nr:hypothetical protein [Endozoicomonas sp. ONNA2]
MVEKPTQSRGQSLFRRLKQGVAGLSGKPSENTKKPTASEQEPATSENPTEKPVDDLAARKPEKTAETNEQPITVVHKPSLSERTIEKLKVVGSYLVAPLKLISGSLKFVTKPLQDHVITPAYEELLLVFQPAKYHAIKLAQKEAAKQAEHDKKQAKQHRFETECQLGAKSRFNQLNEDAYSVQLARQHKVTDMEVAEKIARHKPRAEANFLFKQELNKKTLELKQKEELHQDSQTGEEYYITRTRKLKIADETNRATVTIKAKTPDNKVVAKQLDADNAQVARRLGNDPTMAQAMTDYYKDLEAHKKKMEVFNKENAQYQRAREKAAKKKQALDKQAPVNPGEPPKPPVFKCTDENVIAAFKLDSKQYRTNLQTVVQTLENDVEEKKAKLTEAYHDHFAAKDFINEKTDPENYKKYLQERLESDKSQLEKMQEALNDAEKTDSRQVEEATWHINILQENITVYQNHLEIYDKECQKMMVEEELGHLEQICTYVQKSRDDRPCLQKSRDDDVNEWKKGVYVDDPDSSDHQKRISGPRDRLEIERLKEWVYKDAKGNVLDIYMKDAHGLKIGINKEIYAKVNDVIIPAPDKKLTPAYDGKTSAPDHQHQQGMKWSKINSGKRQGYYQSYLAERDDDGDLVLAQDDTVVWQVVPGQLDNHWMVKPSNVNGRHAGYNKYKAVVKGRASAEEPHALTRKNLGDHNRLMRHTRDIDNESEDDSSTVSGEGSVTVVNKPSSNSPGEHIRKLQGSFDVVKRAVEELEQELNASSTKTR